MACPETWPVAVLALCGLTVVTRTASAAAGSTAVAEEQRPPLARLEVALIGDFAPDPVFFERIRSLFPAQTAVVLRDLNRIDQRAVLLPQRTDTVYLWIRVGDRTAARVYLAVSDGGGRARFLFREVRLDAGLDEVGGETLAEVAHSSALALWQRELQTSQPALLAALERDTKPSTPPAPPIRPPPSAAPLSRLEAHESLDLAKESVKGDEGAKGKALRLGLGASDTMHASGDEGWLHEPGGFLSVEYRALSLRAAGRYLVPTAFDLPPVRVHLSGATSELRAGWLSNESQRFKVRLEAGLGVFWGHAQASVAVDEPMAHALGGRAFSRVYTLAAAAVEWRFGPAWLALGGDLRVPLQTTSYEVMGESNAGKSSPLSPGGSLEVGVGFDSGMR